MARPADNTTAQGTLPFANLPLISQPLDLQPNAPPAAWISEVSADLHALRVGDEIRLPFDTGSAVFTVAGIWRDYARQTGSIVIDRELYVRITGDRLAKRGGSLDVLGQQLLRSRAGAAGEAWRCRQHRNHQHGTGTRETLSIFDRTFAVTYALEVVAVLIGLFGVSVSFSARHWRAGVNSACCVTWNDSAPDRDHARLRGRPGLRAGVALDWRWAG